MKIILQILILFSLVFGQKPYINIGYSSISFSSFTEENSRTIYKKDSEGSFAFGFGIDANRMHFEFNYVSTKTSVNISQNNYRIDYDFKQSFKEINIPVFYQLEFSDETTFFIQGGVNLNLIKISVEDVEEFNNSEPPYEKRSFDDVTEITGDFSILFGLGVRINRSFSIQYRYIPNYKKVVDITREEFEFENSLSQIFLSVYL